MTIRGGGDPPLNPWLPSRCEEWARRPGASPLMRMTASWFRSSRIDRIQGCGAICVADGELPSELSSFAAPQKGSHPTNAACRRARDGQGQVASRRPAAALDRHCARRPGRSQVGTRRWSHSGPNREMGNDRRSSLTSMAPYKGYGCRPFLRAVPCVGPASGSLQGRNPRDGDRGLRSMGI
jgi:hypothetical protein